MNSSEHVLGCAGADLACTLTIPDGAMRGVLIALHPAGDGSRAQPLFTHLAEVLAEIGVAVVRYDRRATVDGDVPFDLQAADLRVAVAFARMRMPGLPLGLWGASQGAWIALQHEASEHDADFMILVGCSAVSPAAQMRYGTARQLRLASFDDRAVAELAIVRHRYEAWNRGEASRADTQAVIDEVVDREWFPLAWVPSAVPRERLWRDLDLDPAPLIGAIGCPVLVVYGDDDWVPVRESIEVWHREYPRAGGLAIRELPRSGHLPIGEGPDGAHHVDPDYAAAMVRWITDHLDTR